MSLRPGSIVGEYQVVKKLGEGGMGEVYLAMHRTVGQRVVLKGLHREYLGDQELNNRLTREAETMVRLAHPNIVGIYNFIHTPDGAFIVMEYVEGIPFDDLIQRNGAIPIARSLELFEPVLQALQYAHEQGVIHRDLKPANLMLGFDGRVRVLDFGTAKLVDRPGLTRVGMTLGTATYMPPEQLMGRDLTPATDVYAAGVTLFEMLTGRLPFEGDDTAALVRRIHKAAPTSPRMFNPAIPKELEDVLLRSLAKDPRARYQSARELGDALRAVAARLQPAPPGPPAAYTSTGAPVASPVAEPRLERPPAAAAGHPAAAPAPPPARRLGAAIAAIGLSGAGAAGVAAGIVLLSIGSPFGTPVAGGAAVLWAAGTLALSALLLSEMLRLPVAGPLAAPQVAMASPPLQAPAAAGPPPAAPFYAAPPEALGGIYHRAFAPTAVNMVTSRWRHVPFDAAGLGGGEEAAAPSPAGASAELAGERRAT
jgi:serine/threonine-protein kinase